MAKPLKGKEVGRELKIPRKAGIGRVVLAAFSVAEIVFCTKDVSIFV